MSKPILDALSKLDPLNDNHWTSEGAPRLDTVKLLMGDNSISRDMVTAAAPGFSRHVAQQGAQPAVSGGSPSPAAEVAPAGTQGPAQGVGNGEVEGNAGGDDADAEEGPGAEGAATQDPLIEANRRYAAALVAKAEADRAAAEAGAAVDRILEAREQPGKTPAHAVTVQAYLSSQKAVLALRADQKAALRGVNLKDILPTKSVIDEAFARRTGRAGKRPVKL